MNVGAAVATPSVDFVFIDTRGIGLDEVKAALGVLAHEPLDAATHGL